MPVYCITGTNRGLGLEFVRQLAQSADNTILACTRSVSSDLTDLKAVASTSTHILACDVGDLGSIREFVKEAAEVLAGKKIDFLLNSAGINPAGWQSSLSLGPDDLLTQIRVNVLGPAKVVEFLLEADRLAEDVRIMNMSSGLGSMQRSLELKPRKCAGYSISKAALNMLSIHQAEDLKEKLPGAVVILMDPGWVKTRMGGEGAILTPEESISGMLKVAHGLKEEDNAKFYHYSGKQVPW
jgi:NAD(P)-dependent dehydrogenase (short-subunit alcohol dehydrogenase family)